MSSVLPLDQVIQLSAIYYFSVFLLEVPSGYFSDRIGRRSTLLLAACSLVISYIFFLIGGSFTVFAFGQFFLAAGIAMQSGTDTALHYDSLKAAGREREYERREAKAEQWGLTALAVATLSGGVLGLIDLRLAYVLSLCGAMVMLVLAWKFSEPAHALERTDSSRGFVSTLGGCIVRLRDPVLAWLFVFTIVLYALAHIVFEFYQPYITLLDIAALDANSYASLISGIVISVSMFGGAIAAKVCLRLQHWLGLIGLLVLAMLIQLTIVGSMALMVHSCVLVLIFARNFPMSLVHAPVYAAIAPRIDSAQRATYLSLQGLSDRVVFAALLLVLSVDIEKGQDISASALEEILSHTFIVGIASALVLCALIGKIAPHLKAVTAKSVGR